MSESGKLRRNEILAAVLIVAAALYIVKLHFDLTVAQERLESEAVQVEKWRANSENSQKAASANAAERDSLQVQLKETVEKLSSNSAEYERAKSEIESLKANLDRLRRNLAYSGKLSGYWRDLFDYTKDFDGVPVN